MRNTTFANFMLGHLVVPQIVPPRKWNIGGLVRGRPPAPGTKFVNAELPR